SVKSHLTAASYFTSNLLLPKPPMLTDILNAIHATRATATRNRALASLSGFFRWLRLRGIFPQGYNPLEGIKILHEEHAPEGIVIWEKNEIPALTKAADTMKDGIAVWVAIYAGLRRGEIHRLQWKDVTPAYIIVNKSKTGKMRHVPLSSTLAKRLAKESKKGPRVVPWSDSAHGWESSARRVIYEKLPAKLVQLHKKHPEKFGWNPFRHTFASRHA
ncbi:MAG: tyrosine-type recombinase/integrase, partial [Planctomycetes bacterium]|nr:tyrosine-type recombinase/integrase [Planctomycetota bacterium]